MIKTLFLAVGLLWLAKRVEIAKGVQNTLSEMVPTDPYSSVTWQWDALNGSNLTPAGHHPNAHPAFSELYVGAGDPILSRPCMCK